VKGGVRRKGCVGAYLGKSCENEEVVDLIAIIPIGGNTRKGILRTGEGKEGKGDARMSLSRTSKTKPAFGRDSHLATALSKRRAKQKGT